MNGPDPDRQDCLACLMDGKQRQWEMFEDKIKAGLDAPGDAAPAVIPWPRILDDDIRPGQYRGVCYDFPQMGIVDRLCWNHVAGINPTTPEDSAAGLSTLATARDIPAAYKRPRSR